MPIDEEFKNEILKIQEQVNTLKEDIDYISKQLESVLESQDAVDPYEKLTKYSYEALNQVKRDLAIALRKDDKYGIKYADKKRIEINKMVDDVIKQIEKIKKDEESRIEFDNPVYPTKRFLRYLPPQIRFWKRAHSARNWLGLLLTGTGLLILSRGIWDASEELFSIQGSIIIGAIIIILMAWLERRKVFAVFGEE